MFSLVSFLTTNQTGSSMITSSGIIPALVAVFNNNRPEQLRNILRATGILDTIIYGFQNGFQTFVTAGGLDLVISRIEAEAKFCVALADANPAEEVPAVETNAPAQTADVAMGEASSAAEPPAMEVDGEASAEVVKVDISPAFPINTHGESFSPSCAPYFGLGLTRCLICS